MNKRSIACVRVKDSDAELGVEQPEKYRDAAQLTLGQFWKGADALTPLSVRLRRVYAFTSICRTATSVRALRLTIKKCGRWVTWLNFLSSPAVIARTTGKSISHLTTFSWIFIFKIARDSPVERLAGRTSLRPRVIPTSASKLETATGPWKRAHRGKPLVCPAYLMMEISGESPFAVTTTLVTAMSPNSRLRRL